MNKGGGEGEEKTLLLFCGINFLLSIHFSKPAKKKGSFTSFLSLYLSFLILQFKAVLYLSSVQLIDTSDTTPMDPSFPSCPQPSMLLLLKFGSKLLARIIFLNVVQLKILMSEM